MEKKKVAEQARNSPCSHYDVGVYYDEYCEYAQEIDDENVHGIVDDEDACL